MLFFFKMAASLSHACKLARKSPLLQILKYQQCLVIGQNGTSISKHAVAQQNRQQLDFRLLQYTQARCMSGDNKNFVQRFFDNMKEEMNKNKEMKESIQKFREEREQLEKSESLRQAREKFEKIESETKSTVKKRLDEYKGKLSETLEDVSKHEYAKKGMEYTEQVGKKAGEVAGIAAETITKTGKTIGQTKPVQSVSQAVKEELDAVTSSRAATYRAPGTLRKRTEHSSKGEERKVEADDDTTTMVLHKDSKFYQSWQNFKENNQYINKIFDLKMKYDESDHLLVRATRSVTDKLGSVFGGMFTKTEMSEVLTEICKMDPEFQIEKFLLQCQRDIIPNILEAMLQGNLPILEDWCHEAPFNTIAHEIKKVQKAGYTNNSRVIDINQIDVAAAKMMEQGPVLVISFFAQQIMVVRDRKGDIIEGDPDKVHKIAYIWALCRDQEELDPRAAWRLLDLSARDAAEMFI